MVQMPSGEAHVLALRKLFLRLDDGSVVGAATKLNAPGSAQDFALISAAQAYGLGRLSTADLSRLQFLLQELHGKVPDAEPLPSLSGGSNALKRKTPDTLEVTAASCPVLWDGSKRVLALRAKLSLRKAGSKLSARSSRCTTVETS